MNQKLLPHRFPFLLIDGTTNSEAGKWAAAYKNISENDWFITESQREMPFSLVVEAITKRRLARELPAVTASVSYPR